MIRERSVNIHRYFGNFLAGFDWGEGFLFQFLFGFKICRILQTLICKICYHVRQCCRIWNT